MFLLSASQSLRLEGVKVPDEGEGLQGTVIAGLDPAIHKETGSVAVVRWIPGSSPGMTCTAGARRIVHSLLQRPRCYGGDVIERVL